MNPGLKIELLALDLESCGRCTRTEANLDRALQAVAAVLREAEVDVTVEKTVVRTAEEAERLRFSSSPTIRMNGQDIALDLRESACKDCSTLCGAEEGSVDCRVWVWRGREYQEAPEPMILDAVLRAYGQIGQQREIDEKAYSLPENLRRFFATKGSPSVQDCCGSTCCKP